MGILLAIHVIITVFLILIVLVQKNEGGSSLFASSGGTGGMFNARGTSNILTKVTWVLASLFLANCVLMASLASSKIKNEQTLIEKKQAPADESDSAPLSNGVDNETAGLSGEGDITSEPEADSDESEKNSKEEEIDTTKEEISEPANKEAEATPDNAGDENEKTASKSEEDSNKEG